MGRLASTKQGRLEKSYRSTAQASRKGKGRKGKDTEELLEFPAGARTAFDDKVDGNAANNRLSVTCHASLVTAFVLISTMQTPMHSSTLMSFDIYTSPNIHESNST
jgi:hypothetical protein